MARSIALAALVSIVLVHAGRAAAQDDALVLDRPTVDGPHLAVDDELASIDAESHAATALYILSPTMLVASAGLAIGAYAANPICFYSCSGDPAAATAYGISSAIAFGLSVVSLGVAIGLDVDSGSRRGGWERRHGASARVGFGATPDGAALSLTGSF